MNSHRFKKTGKKVPQTSRRSDATSLQALKKTNQKLRLQLLRQQGVCDALQENKQRWEASFNDARDGILIADVNQKKILKCNQKIRKMLGYSESELLSLSVKDIHPPKELKRILTIFKLLAKGKMSTANDVPMKRKDGSVFYADVGVSPAEFSGCKQVVGFFRDVTRRQEAEEALLESEEMFRTLSERSPNMIFINQSGKVVYANPQCEKSMGYTSKEFYAPKFNFLTLMHPDDIPTVRRNFLIHQQGKEVVPYEYRMITKDGEVIYGILTSKLIHYRGAPAILGIVTDITERKKNEHDLKASEVRFRSIFESSHDAMMTLEPPSWRFTSANSAMVRMFGAKNEAEFTSYEPWVLSPKRQPDGRASKEKAKKMIGMAMRKGVHFFDWTHKRLNGEDFPVEVLLTRVEEDEKMFLHAVVRDITERKQAEEEIKRSLSLERATLESTADGILVINHTTRKITDFNKRFAQLWDIPNGILQHQDDKKLLKYVLPQLEDPKCFLSKVAELYRHPQKDSFDILKFKDGRIFERYSHPQRIAGRPVGRVWSFRDVTERKRAEETLRRESSFRNAIIENQPGMVWLKDKEGRFLAVNQKFAVGCGHRSSRELVGKTDLDIWPKDLAKKYQADDKRVMRSGESLMTEEVVEDQKIRKWYETFKTPVRDPSGNVLGTSGFARDITERKRIGEELKEAKERLEYVLGATKTGVDVIDAAFNLQYVDPAWQKTYGNPKGRKCYEYFMGRKKMCPGCGIPLALRTRKVTVTEEVLPREGNRRIEVHTIPYQDSSGKWLVAEFNIDITERKRAEETLRESKRQLLRIIDTVPHMIFVKDKHGRFLLVNRATAEAYQKRPKDLIGIRHQDLHKNRREMEGFLKSDREVLAFGRPKLVSKETFTDTLGHKRILQTVKIPFKMARMKDMCILGVSVDVTEQKKVEEFRNNIVRTVSHELRTPLSIEKEGISLLMDEMVGPVSVKQKEILGTVMRSIDRLARMITSLLDISSIETGRIKLLPRIVNLLDIAKGVVFEFEKRAGEKGIDLSVKSLERAVLVFADPDRITQVVGNLVDNAIKFTPRGGTVRVSMAASKDMVECEVRDSGAGIAPENVEKAFEKFQQFSRMAGPGEKGLGLGLSIVKEIVNIHGGRIWLKSELGKGTRVTFSLPLYQKKEG